MKKIAAQVFLYSACISVVLLLGDVLSGVIIGSLGATAFIVFSNPQSKASGSKYVIGGYLCGAVAGVVVKCLSYLLIENITNHTGVYIIMCAAAAAFAMFLMVSLKLPHPPAAALAIGIADNDNAILISISALAGVMFICFVKHCLRNRLEDLFH